MSTDQVQDPSTLLYVGPKMTFVQILISKSLQLGKESKYMKTLTFFLSLNGNTEKVGGEFREYDCGS